MGAKSPPRICKYLTRNFRAVNFFTVQDPFGECLHSTNLLGIFKNFNSSKAKRPLFTVGYAIFLKSFTARFFAL